MIKQIGVLLAVVLFASLVVSCGGDKDALIITITETPYTSSITSSTTTGTTATTQTYIVSFIDWNGTLLKSEYITAGSAAAAPPSPSRTGYTFANWDTSFSNITLNTVVAALYSANSYTAAFNSNGGSGSMANQVFTYDAAQTLSTNAFIRDGYHFAGWATASSGPVVYTDGQSITNLATNGMVTLYAVWSSAPTYSATINGSNAINNGTGAYADGAIVSINAGNRDGYTFSGWTVDSGSITLANPNSASTTFTMPTENVSVTAKWAANTYTIVFNANGGSGLMANQIFTYDIAQALSTNAFIRNSYTFAGWDTNPNGTTIVYTNGQSVNNLATGDTVNIYAVWNQEAPDGFSNTPLFAVGIPSSSNGVPVIIDSMTDGAYNYYLLDAGMIQSLYMGTIAEVIYNGIPQPWSMTTFTEQSITTSLTKTIVDSVTITKTDGGKVGLDVTVGKPDKFAVKGFFEYSWQNSTSSTKSTSNTITTVQTEINSITLSLNLGGTFGNNNMAHGAYRYAYYCDADIYMYIITSSNNEIIEQIDIVVCAREGKKLGSEYSPTGSFDHSFSGISLQEEFWKVLQKPTQSMFQVIGDIFSFNGGFGTLESPYKISSKEHFVKMVTTTDTFYYYALENDINLGNWNSYGMRSWVFGNRGNPGFWIDYGGSKEDLFAKLKPWSGFLDGQNHMVAYSMRIPNTSTQNYSFGLIPATNKATIRNLSVFADLRTSSFIPNSARADIVYCGGLIGLAFDTEIHNCSVDGEVNYNSEGGHTVIDYDLYLHSTYVGGVVGYASGGSITSSKSSANIYGRGFKPAAGGCAGGTLNCSVTGFDFTGSSSAFSGWLFGHAHQNDAVAEVNRSASLLYM